MISNANLLSTHQPELSFDAIQKENDSALNQLDVIIEETEKIFGLKSEQDFSINNVTNNAVSNEIDFIEDSSKAVENLSVAVIESNLSSDIGILNSTGGKYLSRESSDSSVSIMNLNENQLFELNNSIQSEGIIGDNASLESNTIIIDSEVFKNDSLSNFEIEVDTSELVVASKLEDMDDANLSFFPPLNKSQSGFKSSSSTEENVYADCSFETASTGSAVNRDLDESNLATNDRWPCFLMRRQSYRSMYNIYFH
jgi:hypothetical protein